MCEALIKNNVHIVLVCTSRANHLKPTFYTKKLLEIVESPDLFKGKFRQGFDLWNSIMRIYALKGKSFDVIHAIDCRPAVIFPALFYKKLLGIPLVISWWDLFGDGGTSTERSGKFFACSIGRIEAFFETYFRKYANIATVISSNLENRLIKLGFPKEKIYLLRTGSNVQNTIIKEPEDLRKKLNLPLNKIIFCYLGTIFDRDMKLLISSLGIIKKSDLEQPIVLLIGNHNLLNKTCEELNIYKTGFLQTHEEVLEYLFASDYGLIPFTLTAANTARWPSKITDYWSAGLPVLATPITDLKNLFYSKSLGILSKFDDPESYSAILKEAILLSTSEKKTLSTASRIFAEEELDWGVISKRQKDIYLKAIMT